jgi:hypothetical protein
LARLNGPVCQGYNPNIYATGNLATHTDPSGHSTYRPSSLTAGLILGVLDRSVVIAAIVTIFKPARDLMRIMNTLPT